MFLQFIGNMLKNILPIALSAVGKLRPKGHIWLTTYFCTFYELIIIFMLSNG